MCRREDFVLQVGQSAIPNQLEVPMHPLASILSENFD
jgi:hypothetical protein